MFGLFKCTHPANGLGVERKETVAYLDDDFDIVTYHLVCRKCGERVELNYADPTADFLEREMKGQPADHGDELTIAYLDGVHTGKQMAKREWVGLTDEEICGLIAFEGASLADFVRYVESMLRDKNAAPQPADWVGLIRGVRVDGDSVVISTKGNETARKLCEVLLKQKDAV